MIGDDERSERVCAVGPWEATLPRAENKLGDEE
jgi:hypothetical protein